MILRRAQQVLQSDLVLDCQNQNATGSHVLPDTTQERRALRGTPRRDVLVDTDAQRCVTAVKGRELVDAPYEDSNLGQVLAAKSRGARA